WHSRDMNQSEMIVGVPLLLTPWAAFTARTPWLKRGLFAFLLYVVAQTAISTQTIATTVVSDVRFFCALLPLIIALEAFTLVEVAARFGRARWVAVPVALAVFWTNFFQGGMFFQQGLRATPLTFARELADPPADPYTAAAAWINTHVPDGASIWVTPNAMIMPLVFHAPRAVYGWQLPRPPLGQFASVPPIFFEKTVPPDYVVAFGPDVNVAMQVLNEFDGVSYEPVALLDVYYRDLYRPEILWRCFEAVRNFDPHRDGVFVLKRIDVPPPLKLVP
ncbi:MAG: hypothetical protein PHQ12_00145, partial [Chthoniobacteraceae bacterium]|nr:hypothetical protein [Chthoniobacteraceae bacterium]